MSLILNQAQAKAVYDAMCALNNVSAKINVDIENASVCEMSEGEILVAKYGHSLEQYINQSEFAAAYGVS